MTHTRQGFHWKDGWYFERITEPNPEKYGWVRVFHIPTSGVIADIDIEIEPNSWASIVASVGSEGETAFTFRLAQALHGSVSVSTEPDRGGVGGTRPARTLNG